MDPRVSKLKEFPAHADRVTSVALGQQTGDMLVTGGSDKKVNLWSIEKPNCITSFLGLTTPVSYVKFSPCEDQVCAGSQSGNIKIWDLGSLKTSKTLMGHRARIKCIEFHSCSNLLISGSNDSVIKFWDTRRKGAILSYKGHNSAINTLKFSPNGHWFASGGEDGRIKIWEIRKGQILHEFADSSMSVTDMVFHPKNLYLVSCNSDQTIKYFDLKQFTQTRVVTTNGINHCVLTSSNNNNCFYGATNDLISVYEWNNDNIHDFISTNTPKIQDLAISENNLIGVSTKRNTVSIFSIDLKQVVSSGNPTRDALSAGDGKHVINSHVTVDHVCDLKVEPTSELSTTGIITNPVETENTLSDSTQEIFCPQNTLPRTPRTFRVNKSRKQSHSTEIGSSSPEQCFQQDKDQRQEINNELKLPVTVIDLGNVIKHLPKSAVKEIEISLQNESLKQNGTLTSSNNPANSTCRQLITKSKNDTEKQQTKPPPLREHADDGFILAPQIVPMRLCSSADASNPQVLTNAQVQLSGVQENQLSVNHDIINSSSSDFDVIAGLKKNHHCIISVLNLRQQNVRELYDTWRKNDVKATAEIAAKFHDLTALADFLGVLVISRPSKWTLDVCVILLPAIIKLIQSRHVTHILAGCQGLRSMLRNFASVIRTNVASPVETLGVDLTQEARYNKSVLCHGHLIIIRQHLLDLPNLRGTVCQAVKEVQGLLSWLEK
ncbi:unnamed protein product [Allacma fusca]|uniref:Katanin p80 WD40 repeat-containing subunit B1 n=1 Tax=Allacma fusca TaxID=39272 RepID=A0A8J2L275_9HEXA|nr:unnamed protein product [Allacma fusca]